MLLTNFAFLDLGVPELVLILAIALLLFGGKKLPELAKSLGQSMTELKKGAAEVTGLTDDVKSQVTQTRQNLRNTEETLKK